MNEYIDQMVVAPYFSPKFLLYEGIILLSQSTLICLFYVKYQIEGTIPFRASYVLSTWLFFLFALNSALAIFNILFIPQLITLPRQPYQKIQVTKLRELLNSRIYQYISSFTSVVFILYIIGFIFSVVYAPFLTSVAETQQITTFLYSAVFGNIAKYIFITLPLRNYRDAQIAKESSKYFIRPVTCKTPDICPICQATFVLREQIAEYQCPGRHLYHQNCIKVWLETPFNQRKTCPYCKQLPSDYLY